MTQRGVRIAVALGSAAAGIAALAYVGVVDPHRPGAIFPLCPFKFATGWNCPACGGLRMTHDVLHGDFSAAAADNAFLLAGLPLLALWVLWRRARGKPAATTAALVIAGIAVLAWTVIRNLPGFPLIPTLRSL